MDQPEQETPVNINLDPHKTPIYFADGYLISSSQQALTLSFTQSVLDGQQQNVITRVAMSLDQAKQFMKDLNDHFEKFER